MAPQRAVGPVIFNLFPCFPAELRLYIWDFVFMSSTRVIRLQYHNGQLTKVSLPVQPIQLVCKESYKLYKTHNHHTFTFYEVIWKEQKFQDGNVYAVQRKGKQHSFPVNFDFDFFLISGKPSLDLIPNQTIHQQHPRGLEVIYRQPQPFYKHIKKVILPQAEEPSSLILGLIDPDHETKLTNLKEVWLLVRGNGDNFRPEPESTFQVHCPLHHHNEFPSKYSRIEMGGSWDKEKELCPACDWEYGRWDNIPQRALYPCITQRGNFRLTYDACLPKYVGLPALYKSNIPILRYRFVLSRTQYL
ncbi:hypothetical protein V8F33_010471 [Rhypophila sp. PSN 637]